MRLSLLILIVWVAQTTAANLITSGELKLAVDAARRAASDHGAIARAHGEVGDPFAEVFLREIKKYIPDLSIIHPRQVHFQVIGGICEARNETDWATWQALLEGWAETVANKVSPRQMNVLMQVMRSGGADHEGVELVVKKYLSARVEAVTPNMLMKLADGRPEILIPYLKAKYRSYSQRELFKLRDVMSQPSNEPTEAEQGQLIQFGRWISINTKIKQLAKVSGIDAFVDDYLKWRLGHLQEIEGEASRLLTFLSSVDRVPTFKDFSIGVERMDGDYNVSVPLNLLSEKDYLEAYGHKISYDCSSGSRSITE